MRFNQITDCYNPSDYGDNIPELVRDRYELRRVRPEISQVLDDGKLWKTMEESQISAFFCGLGSSPDSFL